MWGSGAHILLSTRFYGLLCRDPSVSICSIGLTICDMFWPNNSHLSQMSAQNTPHLTPTRSPFLGLVWRDSHCRVTELSDLLSGLPPLATKPHLTQGLPIFLSRTVEGQSRGTAQWAWGLSSFSLPVLPRAQSQHSYPAGKAWQFPEIGRLCFHSSFLG